MRVRHVSVSGLFGLFDHEIPLQQESRITLLHGLNGSGKTILLRMIAGALRGNYSVFRTAPFSSFALTFSDGTALRIERQTLLGAREGESAQPFLRFALSVEGRVIHFHEDKPDEPSTQAPFFKLGSVDEISAYVPYLTRIGHNIWRHEQTDELFTREDVIEQYRDQIPQFVGLPARQWEPPELARLREAVQVRFIHIRRLDSFAVRADKGWAVIERAAEPQPAVRRYSDELVDQMLMALAHYGVRSEELDRTFPARLFAQEPSAVLSFENIKARFAALEKKRSQLTELGLLSPEQRSERDPPFDDPSKLGVLSIYVDDIENKLATFNGFAQRIELFLEILNGLFHYKKLGVRPALGLVATGDGGKTIPLTALSAGEQHQIVMLYKLLFRLKPDALVLIDEPELSLHLGWQQRFLSDMVKVVELASIDVLVATHSADIVNEHWDWTVALQGPKK